MRLLAATIAAAALTGCGGSSPAAATAATPSPIATAPTLGACAIWANQQRGAGVAAATGSVATQRQSLYDAGGGIRAVSGKYYAAYFSSGFATSARRRVLVSLHGTGGSPEAQFNDWRATIASRNWAFLGLKYLDEASGAYDDEVTIYSHIKTMIDEVRAACDLGSASMFLEGFSRGSAQAIPVHYLDLLDRRFFSAAGNNSGAWDLGGAPTPTLQAVANRGSRSAMAGTRYWMYCGDLDLSQGFPMCDAMKQAQDFIQTYGGSVAALYRDPTGLHGGLTKNAAAIAQMFAYFEGLP